jgi:hypothetical protein
VSSDIHEVTENRVTITANDTEANIRVAAGFAEVDPDADKAEKPVETETSSVAERNEDGTQKTKPSEPAKPAEKADKDGDPRKSHQAKINQAIAKQREAERRADEAERRASEREAELLALRQPRTAQPSLEPSSQRVPSQNSYLQLVQRYQAMPDAPKLDDFASLEDPYGAHYLAMNAFISDQRQAEREAKESETRQRQERQTSVSTAFEVGEQNHPGLQEQIQADTRIYPHAVLDLLAQEAAQDPQLSAELLFHLVTHPDDADVLSRQVHPIAAAREIGRLTARLSAPSGPETVLTHTTAKPLIKPVRPSVMATAARRLVRDSPFDSHSGMPRPRVRHSNSRASTTSRFASTSPIRRTSASRGARLMRRSPSKKSAAATSSRRRFSLPTPSTSMA